MRVTAAATMAALALLVPAAANDTFATLGAGGLTPVKSATVVMESEDLRISAKRIDVRYVFRNTGPRNVNAVVAFPLPELEGGMATHEPLRLPSRDPVNFVDFRVRIAGQPVAAQAEVRAWHKSRDITDRVLALGLPVSVVDESFQAAVARLAPDRRRRLERDEWIVGEETGRGKEQWYWPTWTTRVRFWWRQRFPAGAAVEVEHSYRPVAGGSFITANNSGASSVERYCGGADALAQVAKLKAKHTAAKEGDPVLFEKRVRYVLTTANNWSGPIRDFRLTVTAADPDDIVLSCMPGLRRVAPARYELQRTSFRPDRDLELLILQARE